MLVPVHKRIAPDRISSFDISKNYFEGAHVLNLLNASQGKTVTSSSQCFNRL
jgi:hypothetical protein